MAGDTPQREIELVRRTCAALEKIDRDIAEYSRQKFEIRERMRRGGKPDLVLVPGLHEVVGKGGVLEPPGNAAAVIVTSEQRSRALLVLDAIIRMMVSRNLRLWVDNGKTLVGRKPYMFELRLSEVAEKTYRTPDVPYATDGWMPTGRLRITLRNGPRPDFRIRDDKKVRLEDQLQLLVDYVSKAVEDGPEKDRRAHESYLARAQLEAQEKEAAQRKRQAEADRLMRLEVDAARLEDLEREARVWREACDIRGYAGALLAARPDDERVRSWTAWATQTADAIDPTQRRLRQIEMGSAPTEPTADDH